MSRKGWLYKLTLTLTLTPTLPLTRENTTNSLIMIQPTLLASDCRLARVLEQVRRLTW